MASTAPEDQATSSTKPRIRLLRITPSDDVAAPVEINLRFAKPNERYVCLSYRWGDESPDDPAILVNGEERVVRKNLFDFLHTARRYSFDVMLWIDAICIDQNDAREKEIHVPMIGSIFAAAQFVVVWLELTDEEIEVLSRAHDLAASAGGSVSDIQARAFDETPESDEDRTYRRYSLDSARQLDVSYMEELWRYPYLTLEDPQRETWSQMTEGEPVWAKARQLPYWRRAWIVQEVLMAQCTWVMTPNALSPIHLHMLLTMINAILMKGLQDPDCLNCYKLQSLLAVKVRGPSIDFDDLLRMTRTCECLYKRDRFYSIVSMTRKPQEIPVNYSVPIEEVFVDAFNCLLEEVLAHMPSRNPHVLFAEYPSLQYAVADLYLGLFATGGPEMVIKTNLSDLFDSLHTSVQQHVIWEVDRTPNRRFAVRVKVWDQPLLVTFSIPHGSRPGYERVDLQGWIMQDGQWEPWTEPEDDYELDGSEYSSELEDYEDNS